MVKNSKENQIRSMEDVTRKDSEEHQAISSSHSLLCDDSVHNGSSDDGEFAFLKSFPFSWKLFIFLLWKF